MIPEEAIEKKEAHRSKRELYEANALEKIITEIRDDPDATKTEKRLASALVALKNSS